VPYLKQFLGFVGISDVEVVVAEGLAISEQSREQGLDSARRAIDRLVGPWPAASGTVVAAGAAD